MVLARRGPLMKLGLSVGGTESPEGKLSEASRWLSNQCQGCQGQSQVAPQARHLHSSDEGKCRGCGEEVLANLSRMTPPQHPCRCHVQESWVPAHVPRLDRRRCVARASARSEDNDLGLNRRLNLWER